jgi:hypothetical protein
MQNERPCNCKGKRTCLLCEHLLHKKARDLITEFEVDAKIVKNNLKLNF